MGNLEHHESSDLQPSLAQKWFDDNEKAGFKDVFAEINMEIVGDASLKRHLLEKYKTIPSLDKTLILNAYNYMEGAIDRLLKIPKFSTLGYTKKYLIERFFPLMIKESLLDKTAKSGSGAMGYFQLMPIGKKASVAYIKSNFGVTKSFDRANPIDNMILGIVYYVGVVPLEFRNGNKNFEMSNIINNKDIQKFSCAQYNAGGGVIRGLIKKYMHEKKVEGNISRDHFASWIVSKEKGISGKSEYLYDEVYDINYKNWFGDKSHVIKSSKNNFISYGTTSSGEPRFVTYRKIHEMIEYVEKIDAIGLRDKKANLAVVNVIAKPAIKQDIQKKVEIKKEKVVVERESSVQHVLEKFDGPRPIRSIKNGAAVELPYDRKGTARNFVVYPVGSHTFELSVSEYDKEKQVRKTKKSKEAPIEGQTTRSITFSSLEDFRKKLDACIGMYVADTKRTIVVSKMNQTYDILFAGDLPEKPSEDLGNGYTLHWIVKPKRQDTIHEAAETMMVRIAHEVKIKQEHGMQISQGNTLLKNASGMEGLSESQSSYITLVEPPVLPKMDTGDILSLDYLQGYQQRFDATDEPVYDKHYAAGYAYKVDAYFFEKDVDTIELKEYIADKLEDVVAEDIVLVNQFGFEMDEYGQTYKQDEIVYVALKNHTSNNILRP